MRGVESARRGLHANKMMLMPPNAQLAAFRARSMPQPRLMTISQVSSASFWTAVARKTRARAYPLMRSFSVHWARSRSHSSAADGGRVQMEP